MSHLGERYPQSARCVRATIFDHDENDGLQDSPRAVCPCGEGGFAREGPTSPLQRCLDGEAIEEVKNVLG